MRLRVYIHTWGRGWQSGWTCCRSRHCHCGCCLLVVALAPRWSPHSASPAPRPPRHAQVEEGQLPDGYSGVQPGDCVVAFSRKDIYAIKQLIERETQHRACVVYGALPPETRRQQARLFNDQGGQCLGGGGGGGGGPWVLLFPGVLRVQFGGCRVTERSA